MDKIKELTDFYMWMQENDYDHNIRARVERKAEIYLNGINVGQKLPIQNVSVSVCTCEMPAKVKGKNECWRCKKPLKDFLQTER
jgi:hypothetical protein